MYCLVSAIAFANADAAFERKEEECNVRGSGKKEKIRSAEGRASEDSCASSLRRYLLGARDDSAGAAQDAATEKAIEKYRQMLKDDPWSNPGLLDADRGEALWKTARGPKNVSLEQCDLGKGAGQGRRRIRRTAALFRRCRPGDGRRDAHSLVHGQAAGLQSGRPREEPASRRRTAGEGTGRDGDLCRQQVQRHEIRRQARQAPKEKEAVALGDELFHRRSGSVRFLLLDLPRGGRVAHPPAGICRSWKIRRKPRRSSANGRLIACRPRM